MKHQHTYCGGGKCVVGWDGVARAVPMDDDEILQREQEDREFAQLQAKELAESLKPKSVQDRVAEVLALHGLSLDDLKAALKE